MGPRCRTLCISADERPWPSAELQSWNPQAVALATAGNSSSANAWWGIPFFGDDNGRGNADFSFNMNMEGYGYGRGYNDCYDYAPHDHRPYYGDYYRPYPRDAYAPVRDAAAEQQVPVAWRASRRTALYLLS